MKKVIAGVLALSLMASPCFAESKAFTRPAGAVIGAGAAYAAGTYLAIPVGASVLVAPAVGATAAVPAMVTAAGAAASGGVLTEGMTLEAAVEAGVAAGYATPTAADIAFATANGGLTQPIAGIAGTPAVFSPAARPDMLFGVSTATLITSAAVGLGAYIIWQAITGDLQPPTVTLVQEGYTAPSGKAYRY